MRLKRLFDPFRRKWKRSTTTTAAATARASSATTAMSSAVIQETQGAPEGAHLPEELVIDIVKLVPGSYDTAYDRDAWSERLETFRTLRTVSHAVREAAESVHPEELTYAACRFVNSYVYNAGKRAQHVAEAYKDLDGILLRTVGLQVCQPENGGSPIHPVAPLLAYLLKHSTHLRQFKIIFTMLDDADFATIPFASCSSLRDLELSMALPSHAPGAGSVLPLAAARQLERLSVSWGSLQAEDLMVLDFQTWKGLKKLELTAVEMVDLALLQPPEQLESLDLSDNLIGTNGLEHLELSRLQHLKTLGLSSCGLTSRALDFLPLGLLPALEGVDLSSNALGGSGGFSALQLGRSSTLKWLQLNRCGMLDEDLEDLLPTGSGLRELHVAGNELLTSAGLEHLHLGHGGDRLKKLDLGGCRGIADAAMDLLAAGQVEELNLSMTSITAAGIKALNLSTNATLRILDLTGVDLPASAATLFGLEANEALQELRLRNSGLESNGGVRKLGLSENKTLKLLELGSHVLDKDRKWVERVKSTGLEVTY